MTVSVVLDSAARRRSVPSESESGSARGIQRMRHGQATNEAWLSLGKIALLAVAFAARSIRAFSGRLC